MITIYKECVKGTFFKQVPRYVCGWVCCAGKRRKKQTGAELEWFVLVGSKRQFECECITCTGNKYMHNNLWQFLFNLIGKVNRDSYSSLSLEGKCQYLTEYIVCFKA